MGGRDDEKEKELGLGVGGAIRNYCGTIDKRRLRGRTTEDPLRSSDFPLFHVVSLFRFSSLFPTRPSWTSVPASCRTSCPRNLPDSSICNVRRLARYTSLRPASSARSTWNGRFFPTLYISVNAPSKPRRDRSDPVNILYFMIPAAGNRYDYETNILSALIQDCVQNVLSLPRVFFWNFSEIRQNIT